MAICQFFLRGTCKFGAHCKNEHPSASNGAALPTAFTPESMRKDLTPRVDKPMWSLSSYGVAKNENTLVGGLDMSFEEMRVKAFMAKQSGTPNEYEAFEANQFGAADQTYKNAIDNFQQLYDSAIRVSQGGSATPAPSSSVFGGGQASTSAFGLPSAFGQPSSLSPSVFGTPTAPRTSVFGATSTPVSVFGQPNTPSTGSVFGQSSAMGSTTPAGTPSSAFGQTTSAFGQSAFGQPSSLIRPETGAVGVSSGGGFAAFAGQSATFGTPAAAAPSSAGQSVFGPGGSASTTTPTSAFGVPIQNPSDSIFGQSSFGNTTTTTPRVSAFASTTTPSTLPGTSAFGSGSNTAPTTSAFGQTTQPTSVFGQTSQPTSVFGQTSQPTSVFGQTTQPTSVFGQTSQPVSVFGAPSQQPASIFGSAPGSQNQAQSVFGAPAAAPVSAFANLPPAAGTSAFGNSQPVSAFAFESSSTAPVSAFGNAAPVSAFGSSTPAFSQSLRPAATAAAPSGRPNFSANTRSYYVPNSIPYDAKLPAEYMSMLPQHVVDAFKAAKFKWGPAGIPEYIPPLELR